MGAHIVITNSIRQGTARIMGNNLSIDHRQSAAGLFKGNMREPR
jgi:hypothetical protein